MHTILLCLGHTDHSKWTPSSVMKREPPKANILPYKIQRQRYATQSPRAGGTTLHIHTWFSVIAVKQCMDCKALECTMWTRCISFKFVESRPGLDSGCMGVFFFFSTWAGFKWIAFDHNLMKKWGQYPCLPLWVLFVCLFSECVSVCEHKWNILT